MTETNMTRLKMALLAATLLAGSTGLALAQPGPGRPMPPQAGIAGPAFDPAQLPAFHGKVTQYLLTPRGDIEGFMLSDGTEVHVNPRLSSQLVYAVRPGDSVTIHGLKAKAAPLVAAASVTNDATNTTVTGAMGRSMRDRFATIDEHGVVKAVLHEPRGEVNGVLLEDGTAVRLPPQEARKLTAELAVGQTLYIKGFGTVSPLGKVVMAQQIGTSPDKMTDIAMPRWHGHEGWSHGPMGDRRGPGGPGFGPMHGPMGGPMGGPPPAQR
jgi:hypothetical protein